MRRVLRAAFAPFFLVLCVTLCGSRAVNGGGFAALPPAPTGPTCCTIFGCNCIFDDEFSGSTIDTNLWDPYNYEYSGFGNQSGLPQCMLPANLVESGGFLTQSAKLGSATCPLPDGGTATTTVSVGYATTQSDGHARFHSIYGNFEVRAKISGGVGPWSSFYMLGTGCDIPPYGGIYSYSNTIVSCGWNTPPSQEIDWFEYNFLGNDDHTTTRFNLITSVPPGTIVHQFLVTPDPAANFHVYTGVWKPAQLELWIDGVDQGAHIVGSAGYIPNTPMYLILHQLFNDGPDAASTYPVSIVWDYVRVTCDYNIGAECVHN